MYDTYLWGEVGAKDGLVGTLAVGPTPIKSNGDLNTVRSGIEKPYMFGLGSLSDTKPQGCALTPSRSNFGQKFYGPGSIHFSTLGFVDLRQAPMMPKPLQAGETLEGFCSSTNVNEGSLVAAHISYGGFPPLLRSGARYKDIFIEQATITSAADITPLSGKVSLDTATTADQWINTEKNYAILGTLGNISAATFGGIMTVTGLGGAWQGAVPGVIVDPLSGVIFSAGAFTAAPEPIPFNGAALPDVSMMATTAGAITFGIVLAEL